jgi:hypothetical protein
MSNKKDKKNKNDVFKANKPIKSLRKTRTFVIIMIMKDNEKGIARNNLQT